MPRDLFGNEIDRIQGRLARDFIIPPFSVFDTTSGLWRNRKRQWIKLGIKSEFLICYSLAPLTEIWKSTLITLTI